MKTHGTTKQQNKQHTRGGQGYGDILYFGDDIVIYFFAFTNFGGGAEGREK